MSRRSLFAAGLKLRASARKSLSYSNTYLGNMFSFIKAGLELRYTFIVLLFLVMAMYATKLYTESLKGLPSLTGFGMMLALGTWRYCKPFLCLWRYKFVRGLLYSKLEFNSTLAHLISFGMMFALMSYLVLLSFKLNKSNRQRAVRHRRVSSCLWTRRKVY